MDIHDTLCDMPETLRNINLSSQLAPSSSDIPRNIPGNIPMFARAGKAVANLGIFIGLSMEKKEEKPR